MKRYILILFTFCSLGTYAQNAALQLPFKTVYGDMQFNTPFYDLEDHWAVVLKNTQNNTYIFGMAYVDKTAGYVFKMEGTFHVDAGGRVYRDTTDYLTSAAKALTFRFSAGTKMLCAIPDAMLPALKVPTIPDWLAIYHPVTQDRISDAYKITRGRFLNAQGAPDKALEYLEPVYKTNPHAPGLEYELGYAYNVLTRFADAQTVMKAAMANAPDNPRFYVELAYAYTHTKDYDNAVKTYTKGIELAKKQNDNFSRSSITTNLVLTYIEMQQYDKAISTANDMAAYAPNSSNSYLLLAMVYEKAGDYKNVAKAYAKGIEVSNPADMQGKAQMAYTLAMVYRDKLNDKEQYTYWGQKAKEWAPANTAVAKVANALVF